MTQAIKVAVVGATGAVGREMLSVLESRKFPVQELVLFASPRSKGKGIRWRDKNHLCQVLSPGCFNGIDIAFFDASDEVSAEWVPQAAEAGAWVVDNSATFRLEKDIPLVIPEVNGAQLQTLLKSKSQKDLSPRQRIVSGPNCSTVQMVVALKPIYERWGIKRIVVSTYQSTSGAGSEAIHELSAQTMDLFNQKTPVPRIFPHQIAFNCIPHIGRFKEDGSTSEELKMVNESRKILGNPELRVSATTVRVPTFSCHSESVNVECEKAFEIEEIRSALRDQPGIVVLDNPKENIYPMALTSEGDRVESATGRDGVYVGRIRRDSSVENGVNLWIVSDNLRKGAALNAVQIGEVIVSQLF